MDRIFTQFDINIHHTANDSNLFNEYSYNLGTHRSHFRLSYYHYIFQISMIVILIHVLMEVYAMMELIPTLALVLRATPENVAQKVCYNLEILF